MSLALEFLNATPLNCREEDGPLLVAVPLLVQYEIDLLCGTIDAFVAVGAILLTVRACVLVLDMAEGV